jgi:hypothetical protein
VLALVTADGYHSCAKLDNAQLKCWGSNSFGQLGLENDGVIGDNPGDMGDFLPFVQLGGTLGFAPPSLGDDEGDGELADDFDDRTGDGVDPELDDAVDAGGCSTSRGGGGGGGLAPVLLALALALSARRRS